MTGTGQDTASAVAALNDAVNGQPAPRSLARIAAEIYRDWGGHMSPTAIPYAYAMSYLNKITDSYGKDSGEEIVLRFLTNSRSWTGPVARRVKAELRELVES